MLALQLLADPRSRFHAAIAGWQHTATWSDFIAMDAFDLTAARYTGKDFKPYARPWVKPKGPVRKKKRTAAEALAVLRPQSARIPPTSPG